MSDAAVVDAQASPTSRIASNLALLASSAVLSLTLLELAARAVLPAPLPWLYPQLRYRSDPSTIFSLAPNQQGFTADKSVAINARGLRGPVIPYARTPDRLRLLFLGDSIVFGYGVNDPEVVTERVAALLGQRDVATEVINSAIPSYNTEQEVAYFEGDGRRYQPDVVIVGICWNDINDKSEVEVDAHGWLVTAGSPAPSGDADATPFAETPLGYTLRNALKRSRLLYAARSGWLAIDGYLHPESHTEFRMDVLAGRATSKVTTGWTRVEAALDRLHALTAEAGTRLLLVTFPVALALEKPWPDSSYPQHLRAYAERRQIPFLDLDGAYRGQFHGHESLFIPYDADHPNAAGHELAAREIVRVLSPLMPPAS